MGGKHWYNECVRGDNLTASPFISAPSFKRLTNQTRINNRLNILATICPLIRVKLLVSSKKVPKGLKLYVSPSQI